MIIFHLDKLDEVIKKMENAEDFIENQQKTSSDILAKEFASAYKYGGMCALSKCHAGIVKINTDEIRKLINQIL